MDTALGNTINRLALERRTGKLHIVTTKNHTASLGFVQGEVVSAHYRISQGEKALAALRDVTEATYKFNAEAEVRRNTPPLPPTREVLRTLGLEQVALAQASAVEMAAETAAPHISAKSQSALRELATEYLGPMASIVCDDVFSRAESVDKAIRHLSLEIIDPANAATFLAEAKRRTSSDAIVERTQR